MLDNGRENAHVEAKADSLVLYHVDLRGRSHLGAREDPKASVVDATAGLAAVAGLDSGLSTTDKCVFIVISRRANGEHPVWAIEGAREEAGTNGELGRDRRGLDSSAKVSTSGGTVHFVDVGVVEDANGGGASHGVVCTNAEELVDGQVRNNHLLLDVPRAISELSDVEPADGRHDLALSSNARYQKQAESDTGQLHGEEENNTKAGVGGRRQNRQKKSRTPASPYWTNSYVTYTLWDLSGKDNWDGRSRQRFEIH